VDNLLRRDADIAVRMVEPAQEALVVKKLGTVSLGLHAHKDYLARTRSAQIAVIALRRGKPRVSQAGWFVLVVEPRRKGRSKRPGQTRDTSRYGTARPFW
jgi:hypothetical protein